jgi:hypothetical protein
MAAATLAPSLGVVLAVFTRAWGFRRRGSCHRRHRRKFEHFSHNFRRWRHPRLRQLPVRVETAYTTPGEGARAAAAIHKLSHP